jgi:hypothetical protein
MSHDTEATSSQRKLRKYDSAIDIRCAFETNDLNLTTANFDSYGNVSFDPCEFTLHTAANAEKSWWSGFMHPAGLSKFSNVPVLHYLQAVLFLKN